MQIKTENGKGEKEVSDLNGKDGQWTKTDSWIDAKLRFLIEGMSEN